MYPPVTEFAMFEEAVSRSLNEALMPERDEPRGLIIKTSWTLIGGGEGKL